MNILVSYYWIKQRKDLFKYIKKIYKDCSIILDSGAFSAYNSNVDITLDEYNRFCKSYGYLFDHYVQLDVVGDHKQTEINYFKSLQEGLNPIPVLQVTADVNQVLKLKNYTDFICISGAAIRGYSKQWLFDRIKEAYNISGLKIHALGLSSFEKDLPIYSCDSTSFLAASKNYTVSIFNHPKVKTHKLDSEEALEFSKVCNDKLEKNGSKSISCFSGYYSYLMLYNYLKSIGKKYYFACNVPEKIRNIGLIGATSSPNFPNYKVYRNHRDRKLMARDFIENLNYFTDFYKRTNF